MPTRPPSLRAVAAFEAAARYASFARAADELNLSHSAISHAIRGLEQRLGAKLFARVGRCVVLTAEGAALAQRINPSLANLTDALEHRPRPIGSRLRIGVAPGLASQVLAPRLGAFRDAYPAIAFDLRDHGSADAILKGELDLVLGTGASRKPGVFSRRIARERLFPVAGGGLPAPARASEAPGALLIESREHPWTLWYSRFGRTRAGDPPGVRVDTDFIAVEMARAGLGICLAPAHLVQRDIAAGVLRRLDEADVPARSSYTIEWGESAHNGPEIGLFVAWLTEAMRDESPPAVARRSDEVARLSAWPARRPEAQLAT
jgi:LysR family glycine cleavage system transcriptional activator